MTWATVCSGLEMVLLFPDTGTWSMVVDGRLVPMEVGPRKVHLVPSLQYVFPGLDIQPRSRSIHIQIEVGNEFPLQWENTHPTASELQSKVQG